MAKTRQFEDAAEDRDPFLVKYGGKQWKIPPPSAKQQLLIESAMVRLQELSLRDPEEQVSVQEEAEIRKVAKGADISHQMAVLIGGGSEPAQIAKGEKVIEQMFDAGMELETFKGVFRWVFGLDPEMQAPNREARRRQTRARGSSRGSSKAGKS